MFCSQCGAKSLSKAKYCHNCGESIDIDIGEDYEDVTKKNAIQVNNKARPWIRYWARIFDISLFGLPILMLFWFSFPELMARNGSEHLISMVVLFSWVFIEAGLLSTLGTTPGKVLFNIRLTTKPSHRLDYWRGLKRSLRVYLQGLGAGLPIVNLVAPLIAYKRLSKDHTSAWDLKGGFLITHGPINSLLIFTSFSVLMFLYGSFIISVNAKPAYTDAIMLDLSISEFCGNYSRDGSDSPKLSKRTINELLNRYESRPSPYGGYYSKDKAMECVSLVVPNKCVSAKLQSFRAAHGQGDFNQAHKLYNSCIYSCSNASFWSRTVGACRRDIVL